MACSTPTVVNISLSDTEIRLGDTLTATVSFETDDAGDACQQTLNLVLDEASSPDTQAPADEDTDYDLTWTPSAAQLGEHTVRAQCVWSPTGYPGTGNTLNGANQTVTVVRFKEGEAPEGSWTEGSAPSGSWTEGSAPSGSWTEGSAPSGSWTEGSAPSGSWTEES